LLRVEVNRRERGRSTERERGEGISSDGRTPARGMEGEGVGGVVRPSLLQHATKSQLAAVIF